VPAWLLAWSFAAAAVAHVSALQGGALLNLSTPAAPQQFALASLPGAAPLAPGASARARLSVRTADGGAGQAPLINAVSLQGLACPAQGPYSPAAVPGQGAAAAPALPPACGASTLAGAPEAAWSPTAASPGAQPPCALSFCCPPVPALAPSDLLSGAAGGGAAGAGGGGGGGRGGAGGGGGGGGGGGAGRCLRQRRGSWGPQPALLGWTLGPCLRRQACQVPRLRPPCLPLQAQRQRQRPGRQACRRPRLG